MTALLVVCALVAMAAAAVVSGFETGIYALSRIRLRHRLSAGDARAAVVERMLENPQQLLSGILLAQNVAVYFTTAIATTIFARMGGGRIEGLGTVALAVVMFVFVEAVPKNVFRRAADVLVYPVARPFGYVMTLMRPAGWALGGITGLASRLGAGKRGIADPFFTRERLAFYLREGLSEGILSRYQVELTNNILRGEKVTVSRAMVPLEKAATVPYEVTREQLDALAKEKQFSRYPVYRGGREQIAGIVNIYDCHLAETCAFEIGALLRPAVFFAPEVQVTEAIRSLREARQPMGIVSDKGRAVGIVTIKDCVEEIVGELYAW